MKHKQAPIFSFTFWTYAAPLLASTLISWSGQWQQISMWHNCAWVTSNEHTQIRLLFKQCCDQTEATVSRLSSTQTQCGLVNPSWPSLPWKPGCDVYTGEAARGGVTIWRVHFQNTMQLCYLRLCVLSLWGGAALLLYYPLADLKKLLRMIDMDWERILVSDGCLCRCFNFKCVSKKHVNQYHFSISIIPRLCVISAVLLGILGLIYSSWGNHLTTGLVSGCPGALDLH